MFFLSRSEKNIYTVNILVHWYIYLQITCSSNDTDNKCVSLPSCEMHINQNNTFTHGAKKPTTTFKI